MTEQTGAQPSDLKRDRLVIVASSLGTVFEWYDFFLYGILAALIGRLFFPIDNPTAATLASLATFGAGFGVRPLGALAGGALAAAGGPAAGMWLVAEAFGASFLVAALSDLARLRSLPAAAPA